MPSARQTSSVLCSSSTRSRIASRRPARQRLDARERPAPAAGAARRSRRGPAAGTRWRARRRRRRCRRASRCRRCGAPCRRSCSSAPPSATSAARRGRRTRRGPTARPRTRRAPRPRPAAGRAACAGRSAPGSWRCETISRPGHGRHRGGGVRGGGDGGVAFMAGSVRVGGDVNSGRSPLAPASPKITARSQSRQGGVRLGRPARPLPCPPTSSSPKTRPTSASCW